MTINNNKTEVVRDMTRSQITTYMIAIGIFANHAIDLRIQERSSYISLQLVFSTSFILVLFTHFEVNRENSKLHIQKSIT